jgi:hypothetical protein
MNRSQSGLAVESLEYAGIAFADDPAPAQTEAVSTVSKVDFTVVDADKDGRISQSEARSYGGTLDTGFSKLDADKDRYLSKMEFGKWEPAKPAGASSPDVGASDRSPAPKPTAPAPSESQNDSPR